MRTSKKEHDSHSNSIEEIARKLKMYQPFEIEWIDASESDVTSMLLPLLDPAV